MNGEALSGSRRLHPASLISGALRFIPQAVAGGAGYAAVIADRDFREVVMFALAAAALAAAAAVLGWWRFRYTLGEGEIVIESGVLQRNRRVIPFHRVQDVAVDRNLLARALGTASVRIETGGAADDEGRLDMVALAEAERIRDRVRAWAGAAVADGDRSAAPDLDEAAEPLLFVMDLRRLLLSGLFNFSLLFLAVIFGFLNYLREFGLIDPDAWISRETADAAASRVTPWVLGLFAAMVLLLGMVTGIARTVARDWRFRLMRTGRGLRRRRGLFTLSEAVIPIQRVQAAILEEGIVQRLAGFASLSLQTLGGGGQRGDGGGIAEVAPFARPQEIAALLACVGMPVPPGEGWMRTPRRSLLRRCVPLLLIAVFAGLAAWFLDSRIAIGAGVLALLTVGAAATWRRHRYAVGAGHLYVSRGLLTRRTSIIPVERLQAVTVTAGPLQRRLGLASLLADTAGASVFSQPVIVDLEQAVADRLAGDLLRLHKDANAVRRCRGEARLWSPTGREAPPVQTRNASPMSEAPGASA